MASSALKKGIGQASESISIFTKGRLCSVGHKAPTVHLLVCAYARLMFPVSLCLPVYLHSTRLLLRAGQSTGILNSRARRPMDIFCGTSMYQHV